MSARIRSGMLIILAAAAFASPENCLGQASPGPDANPRNIILKKLTTEIDAVALEYTVLMSKGGDEKPVDPADHKFVVGDRFLIRIEPKSDAYIYVFNEGPTGERVCLLPGEHEKPPLAKAGKTIELPEIDRFEFAPPPGDEKLIVVATSEPSKDLAALANVVFRKPADLLTSEEKAERENLKTLVEKTLKSCEQPAGGARMRGVPKTGEWEAFLAQLKAAGSGLVEIPYSADQPSTFVMAARPRGTGKPSMVVRIVLKSVAPATKP